MQAVTRKYVSALGVGSKAVQAATLIARQKLIELAKSGDLDAMKLLLDRATGKLSATEQIELPTLPTKPTKSTIAQTKRRLIARIHALNPDLAEAEATKPASS